MRRPLIRTLLFLALAAGIGMHLAVLQGVAWLGMISKYSQTRSLSQAVAMTFDGRHPCPLCVAVNEARNAEKSSPQNPSGTPAENQLILMREDPAVNLPRRAPVATTRIAENSRRVRPRAEAPPVPPPRTLA